mmetsp:Transcript_47985/g.104430  ORF Transcript_47985/g.104430 Transcript_47985/m.104430 type:complete len:287 (-) Transcript_47985:282-1142(-)
MIVLPASNLNVVILELSSCRKSSGASLKIGLAANMWPSPLSPMPPKPEEPLDPRSLLFCRSSDSAPIARFNAVSLSFARSRSRTLASGCFARTGVKTSLENFMQWHCVAATTFAVRRSRRSRMPISPKRSCSSLPRNSPHAVTSTAPQSRAYMSSQFVSPSWIMTRPGRTQREVAATASSATKGCKTSSWAKKGNRLKRSQCCACCSRLMSSFISMSWPDSISFAFICLWNFFFSQGYFSKIEWNVLRKMIATSHFMKERTEAVRKLSKFNNEASPKVEPSRSLQT